jgi:hypothetical protein
VQVSVAADQHAAVGRIALAHLVPCLHKRVEVDLVREREYRRALKCHASASER